ncbi:hypothetical protein B0J11DRAFT_217878 [Dendryphion nanum]|uniref:Uncharacterized protein n=1 Tax=Dendryphion nanum TaxID=256645 RepID=A0A9P9IVB9_9PLEO|nr:hypothetical protein B0J11DRAFT_217878 [Dendryphion nanum]
MNQKKEKGTWVVSSSVQLLLLRRLSVSLSLPLSRALSLSLPTLITILCSPAWAASLCLSVCVCVCACVRACVSPSGLRTTRGSQSTSDATTTRTKTIEAPPQHSGLPPAFQHACRRCTASKTLKPPNLQPSTVVHPNRRLLLVSPSPSPYCPPVDDFDLSTPLLNHPCTFSQHSWTFLSQRPFVPTHLRPPHPHPSIYPHIKLHLRSSISRTLRLLSSLLTHPRPRFSTSSRRFSDCKFPVSSSATAAAHVSFVPALDSPPVLPVLSVLPLVPAPVVLESRSQRLITPHSSTRPRIILHYTSPLPPGLIIPPFYHSTTPQSLQFPHLRPH